jgi:hypothetical protein
LKNLGPLKAKNVMKQPFICPKKLCRRRRCVYTKTANKKIRSKEGTFPAPKNGNF